MKSTLLFILLALASATSFSQSNSVARDSVSLTYDFQRKVRMAALKAANALLADPQQPVTIRKYSQVLISTPLGDWRIALSYGCMTNPAINYNSSDSDIEFTINSIFAKYALAYFSEPQQ